MTSEIPTGSITEKISTQERLVSVNDHVVRKYYPSSSEVLLEDISRSFGTILEQATSGDGHLTRISSPVVLANRVTGDRYVFESQYTRFSPLNRDFDKVVAVWDKNDPKGFSRKKLEDKLSELDTNSLVIDNKYMFNAKLARFRKAFYFSLFGVSEKEDLSELKPFNVFENGTNGVGDFKGRRPDVYIYFTRSPRFIVKGRVESQDGLLDKLSISFPGMLDKHNQAAKTAHTLNPTIATGIPEMLPFLSHDIPASEPIERTMAFIQSYIRKFATGSTL